MASASSNYLDTFTLDTRTFFLQYLRENPNNRRVSQTDKESIIEWLTNPHKRPLSQEEFSRRNYVRKTSAWDEMKQNLVAVAKGDKCKDRTVVTEDTIADVVELVHKENVHGGWDATWKDVSTSYYGILRADVIFLVKECEYCRDNPSKRPKGSTTTRMLNIQPTCNQGLDFLNTGDV